MILTGPSSCGKGEVANALCELVSVDPRRHLSMGEILRTTAERSKADPGFATLLEEKYDLSRKTSIFDCLDTNEELTEKVQRYLPDVEAHFGRKPSRFISEDVSGRPEVSQLDWLEFCTARGLLIPNRWTQDLISAEIERALAADTEGRDSPFILDGYPRTVAAAQHLLGFLADVGLPVLKVLHLSISKAEMSARAGKRGRADDNEEALRRRFEFYVDNVQPSVDYLKTELGEDRVALIDANQPAFTGEGPDRVFDLNRSIDNVVSSALRALGVPGVIMKDLLEGRAEARAEALANRGESA